MQARSVMYLAPALLLAAALAPAPITFEEIAERAGIRFITDASPTPEKQQPEVMIAGVGLLDYDADGFLDVYLVNGAHMPSLVKQGERHKNRLYRNNHDLTFTDVTDKAGVAGAGYGMGVAVADYDNDGRPDLFIANVTANQLFHNNGDGTFTDVTAKAGVTGGLYAGKKMWSVAGAWFDYNNDGLLDLFVSNYCQWDPKTNPVCEVNGHRVSCNPRYFKPLPNTLYRNNGDGTFKDVSAETGIAKHFGRGMGVAIADYDDDGFQDVYVANDDAPSQLFHNVGGKRFEEVAFDAGVALPEEGNVISGMGVDFRDLFNTGKPSLWVTAVEKQTFPLYKMTTGPGPQFIDQTAAAGLALETAQMSGWSNAIVDLDADGWKDLFVARSNVIDNIGVFSARKYHEPNSIFRNLGAGRFENVSAAAGPAFHKPEAHRGAAFGDLDNDGRIDLVVSVLNGRARVFRNTTTPGNHWLMLNLRGTKSNRQGVGASIRLTTPDGKTQYNHATTSTGYASSSDPRVYFGLGAATSAKTIEVRWPSGTRQVLRDVASNQILATTEP